MKCFGATLLWFMCLPIPLLAESSRTALEQHAMVLAQAEDCSLFRRLESRFKKESAMEKTSLDEFMKQFEKNKSELDECALKNQIAGGEKNELLAELCPESYTAWIVIGYAMEVTRENLQSARQSFSDTVTLLRRYCKSLPRETAATN